MGVCSHPISSCKDPFNYVVKENVILIVVKTTDVSLVVHMYFSKHRLYRQNFVAGLSTLKT